MGCSGSRPEGEPAAGAAKPGLDLKALEKGKNGGLSPAVSKRDMLEKEMNRLSSERPRVQGEDKKEQVERVFRKYRSRSSAVGLISEDALANGPNAPRPKMKKKQLREMLDDVPPALFDFVWGLFDANNTGFCYSDEFAAALSLLTAPAEEKTVEEQIALCFAMFDTKGDGRLSREEFKAMLEATVTLNLQRVLESEEGSASFAEALKKEYSSENLDFWKRCGPSDCGQLDAAPHLSP
jgi:hypothetical protein